MSQPSHPVSTGCRFYWALPRNRFPFPLNARQSFMRWAEYVVRIHCMASYLVSHEMHSTFTLQTHIKDTGTTGTRKSCLFASFSRRSPFVLRFYKKRRAAAKESSNRLYARETSCTPTSQRHHRLPIAHCRQCITALADSPFTNHKLFPRRLRGKAIPHRHIISENLLFEISLSTLTYAE